MWPETQQQINFFQTFFGMTDIRPPCLLINVDPYAYHGRDVGIVEGKWELAEAWQLLINYSARNVYEAKH
jgi:hypothetical protein